jgi:hypothetical protein
MDLNDIDIEISKDAELVDIPINDKNGDPYLADDGKTPCTVGVYGNDSPQVKRARAAVQRRVFRGKQLDEKEALKGRIEIATAGVGRWMGWTNGGADYPCTPSNVHSFLQREHILEQVERGIKEHGSLFTTPSNS